MMASLCAYTSGTDYREIAIEDFQVRPGCTPLNMYEVECWRQTIDNGTITSLYLAHV